MNTSGDGFLATFDGPQRAIRCAIAIRDAVQTLGIQVRAGLHTGECEVRGDDIGGIGVHIGARVSALAGANEVLVSSTLRDLVIGSGLEFEERGAHQLKDVPGEGASSPSLSSHSRWWHQRRRDPRRQARRHTPGLPWNREGGGGVACVQHPQGQCPDCGRIMFWFGATSHMNRWGVTLRETGKVGNR